MVRAGGEMAELYYIAFCRVVKFYYFITGQAIAAAGEDL
jgi:hypothetical protein